MALSHVPKELSLQSGLSCTGAHAFRPACADAAPCISFGVVALAQANSLIQCRCALKGTGTITFEALTLEEAAL